MRLLESRLDSLYLSVLDSPLESLAESLLKSLLESLLESLPQNLLKSLLETLLERAALDRAAQCSQPSRPSVLKLDRDGTAPSIWSRMVMDYYDGQ
jgi:hypothetical protein